MPYQEEENSVFSHNKITYDLNTLLRYAESINTKTLPIKFFEWHKKYTKLSDLDLERVNKADLNYPILYIIDPVYDYTVIDGTHRLFKSFMLKLNTIKGKEIPLNILAKAKIT